MKTIKIKANLSKEKEAIEVAKQILKSPVLIGNNSFLIGKSGIEIQELESYIKIERIPVEPLMSVCTCCETNFQKNTGSKIWVNYGSKKKELEYCSDKCRSVLIEILPKNRYSFKSTKINNLKFF